MSAAVRFRVEPEFLLAHARRADREGAAPFAEAVARWVVGRTTAEGDNEGRWAAIGDLGRILERASRLEEALKLWREAFDRGSTDPETANRLSMHLERAKDYPGASAVIHDALTRGLSANVEESLRKRLARCQAKNSQGTPVRNRERVDVAAYSVRRESTLFDPVFQVRLKPTLKHLELVGQAARCLLVSKEASTLVDIDLTSGAEIRRVKNLPLLGDTLFAPDGRGIGVRRTAAIGQGPTLYASWMLKGMWPLSRPCRTPRLGSRWGLTFGISAVETATSTASVSTARSAGRGKHQVRRGTTTARTAGRAPISWLLENRLRRWGGRGKIFL